MRVDKHLRVQDTLCTDPQDLQKSFNRHEDLHCVPLVDVVNALVLLLSPLVSLLQHTKLSQSHCLLSEIILSCIFGFCSPL